MRPESKPTPGDDRSPGADPAHGRVLAAPTSGSALTSAILAESGRLRRWTVALRVHQWAKNLLLFVPLLLAGPSGSVASYPTVALGFVVFCALASAGYVINDLLDLEADRQHHTKRQRPFAAGLLPIGHGVIAILVLVVIAISCCIALPPNFRLMAAVYFGGTLMYSLGLKRVPMLDVLVLAGLFTVRILAGAVLLPVPVSLWLLTFSMFLFLSLALVKRYTELADAEGRGAEIIASRGYRVEELILLLVIGGASAISATVIFVVYLINEQFPSGVYRAPHWLWLIFPVLLFWLLRLWRLAVCGWMHDDPVLFALRDRLSLGLGAVVLVLLGLAW